VSDAVRGRYSRSSACPICGGYPTLPAGHGVRCFGFPSSDGRWAFCTREEHAGDIAFNVGANAYGHALAGACRCGLAHGFRAAQGRAALIASPPKTPRSARPALEADTLDRVYRRYLQLNPLRREHRDYFASRGPADLAVALEHGYGSLPLGYHAARRTIDTLVSEFGIDVMERCPGFYPGKDGRLLTHTGRANDDAAVIAARDEQGRISALQRRSIGGTRPKYMNFYGGTNHAYTIAGSWPAGGRRHLVVIEGLHKAHVVASHSTGARVLGMIGAHLNDAHLAAIERLRPDVVIEALDADKFTNPAVGMQRAHLHEALTAAAWATADRVEIVTAVWEADEGKGLDDLLATGRQPRLRTVARRPDIGARKPTALLEPGPLAHGRPLAEVQAEAEGVIGGYIRDRAQKHGRVKVVQVPPGVGKTRAMATAVVKHGAAARIVVSTTAKAVELSETFPRIRAVEGRNEQNCRSFDVVEAARQNRHDVAVVVCGQCPYIDDCRMGGYYAQFTTPGPLVGTVEMLYSGAYLRRGELVVLDDPSLERAMIDVRNVDDAKALRIASAVPSGPTRELMTAVQRAIDGLHSRQTFAPPLIGAAAWDALARAVAGAEQLVDLIRQVPDEEDIRPAPEDGRVLTVEDIEAAPPAVLAVLIRTLKRELPAFLVGREFTSGLSIHPGGLELRTLRPMLSNKDTGRPLLADKAVLVLDATPIMPLYERLAQGLTLEPVYAPEVSLPPNVFVTQLADRFFGKTAVERQADDGRRPGRDALLASLASQRQRYPGDREAAICATSLKDEVVATGIDEDRVLTFFGSRGLNAIEDADVLHVLGRPQAPDFSALLMANVLHQGEAPIRPHMAMRSEPYAGYRAADGTGRAITVADFRDTRASVLFRAFREHELLQAVHRARLFRVGSAQIEMFASDGQRIARTASERQRVRLVIHSAHPIPGLRVDELLYSEASGVNESRAVEAAERILAAATQLVADGGFAGVHAVARLARAGHETVARVLSSQKFGSAPATPLEETVFTRGVAGAGSNIPPAADERPPAPVPRPFAPSAEWQDMPPGFVCPRGVEWRTNLTTGASQVRWPDLAAVAGGAE